MEDSLLQEEIEQVIEKEIRPSIRSHGGDIRVRSVHGGEVRIVLTGACQSCPAAQITTETLVESTLKKRLGEAVKSVQLYAEVDPEVWAFAKQLLHHDEKGGHR